jgi:hypothetical protein
MKCNLDEITKTGQKGSAEDLEEVVKTALEEFEKVKRSNLGSKNKF